MSDVRATLRSHAAAAWTFHRASSRWPFNMLSPDVDESPEPGKEDPALEYLPLDEPMPLVTGLGAAIAARHSCREFSAAAVTKGDLGVLLHHALGVVGTTTYASMELARRPCPSPGGLYPLELYFVARRVAGLSEGIYHYHAQSHSVGRVAPTIPGTRAHSYLFMDQPYAAQGAANLVITCVFDRSLKKYRDRGYRYALIEAGHVGQNIALACASLGLGCCPLGGFFDTELGSLLQLDPELEAPLYALTIGRPAAKEADCSG